MFCKNAGGANVCFEIICIVVKNVYIYTYIHNILIYHVGANFSKKPGEQNVCFQIIYIVVI